MTGFYPQTGRRGRWTSIASAFAAAVTLTVASHTLPAAAQEEITLNMVGAWAPGVSADADIAIRFMEEVNKNAAGKVKIVYKGSSEVVPAFDQPEALIRGVFDIGYGAPNYWAGVVPNGYITELATSDIPDHGPDSELFNFMTEMFAEKGVRYLGHYSGDAITGSHYMYVQEEISTIDDLKGRTIRVPPLTRFFVEAIGAEPVTLPPGEIYVALDRGTVEGFTWPYFDGFTNFGWQEVTKYLIDEPLYRNGVGIYMNQAKWDSLPEDVQQIMMDAVETTQYWAMGWVAAFQATQLKGMTDAGMQTIELSEEDSKRWAETANEALWKHFESSMTPEDFATARKLLDQK